MSVEARIELGKGTVSVAAVTAQDGDWVGISFKDLAVPMPRGVDLKKEDLVFRSNTQVLLWMPDQSAIDTIRIALDRAEKLLHERLTKISTSGSEK